MKKRKAIVWVVICSAFAVAAFANWIWTMATYDATPEELLMPMSIPNEAMFGACLAWVPLLLSIHVASETKADPDGKIEKGIMPVLRELGKDFWQTCSSLFICIGKLLVFHGVLCLPLVVAYWLFKPNAAISGIVLLILFAILVLGIFIGDRLLPNGINGKLTQMVQERRGIPGWIFSDLFQDDDETESGN